MQSLKNIKTKKVFVGMSGGVDSSVAALLLKQKGYDVTGVFIKVWQPDFIECTWKEDRRDAMRVCSELEIPFITLDLEKEYKEGVIDYMIREYKAGRTPNPDVFCNKEVKFGAFLDWALKNGADYVATGHYAQIKDENLQKGKDLTKDQSYFLWTLNKKQLSKIIFPVGHLLKSEIRDIALKNNLDTAKKKDSQGLCFIGKIDVKDFLKEFIKNKKGNITDIDFNKNIGEHDGVFFYTIGEKINGKYIINKDIKTNILYVSENLKAQKENKIFLENINLLKSLEKGNIYSIAERYHANLVKIKIKSIKEKKKAKELEIEFDYFKGERSIIYTKGQSLVFYKNNILIGGGIMG
jgi:tRNA-specific 2-thiouridylase